LTHTTQQGFATRPCGLRPALVRFTLLAN